MRKRTVSDEAIWNGFMLQALQVQRELILQFEDFCRALSSIVKHSDDETRSKVLLLILDEGSMLKGVLKEIDKNDKDIRKQEYFDADTAKLVIPK